MDDGVRSQALERGLNGLNTSEWGRNMGVQTADASKVLVHLRGLASIGLSCSFHGPAASAAGPAAATTQVTLHLG